MELAVLALAAGCALLLFSDLVACKPDPSSKSGNFRNSRHRVGLNGQTRRRSDSQTCAAPGTRTINAPNTNIWSSLTDDEAASVAKWLFSQPIFNLTTFADAGEWDNSLLMVEIMPPNKTDVVSYLDGHGVAPARYAHVIIDQRATLEPYYQDLLVGPLPLNNSTVKYESLTYTYTRKTEGRVRNIDADQDVLFYEWIFNQTASLLDVTLHLWNGSMLGLENETLTFWNNPTTEFDSETLLPLGLYFKSNVTGRDPSKWTIDGWPYNDVFYPTIKAFKAAYRAPGSVKLPANVDGNWAWTDQGGAIPPLDTKYPPTGIAPSGSRYFVDAEQQYVKWMDFEFYISFSRDTGVHLHDVKYKGDRIIYELGLQEALAHYAGNDPVQSGTSYLDTYYGFGTYAFELVKGYNCPNYATYINSSFYSAETTHTHIDSICLFETEGTYPMQRHSTSQYVASTKNIFFTIWTVCTVGNYDYMFSYEFYMDGLINVDVRASGYIQSAYFAKNGDYGYQIHDALSGSIHDHVLNFKIDFDILGTKNTMTTTENVAVSEVYPWSSGKARNTMKPRRSTTETEDNGKLDWASNGAKQYTVVNLDEKNTYGEHRSYRVLPSAGTIHLTVQNSSNLVNAANWAKHELFVTRQHDTEPRSSHPYQSQDVANPPINFDDFFNSESLVQEDIVVWFNLGMHHVPHSGDRPNTVFTMAHSGLQILLLNYLDGNPSRETVNMVRVQYGGGNQSQVVEFGQGMPMCSVNVEATLPDLESYVGDEVVRKFPYDPNNPYFATDSIE